MYAKTMGKVWLICFQKMAVIMIISMEILEAEKIYQ